MRFLFCSFASPGFLFPLVGLALELRRRGHEVAFATGPEGEATLAGAGIRRISRGGAADGRSLQVATWGSPVATAVDVKHLEHALGAYAPDVLVSHQLCQAATLVRERAGVPLVVMGLFAYPWPTGAADPMEANRRWRLADNLRTLNEARALFALPPVEPGENPLLGDLFLLRTSAALEPAVPPGVHAVGACMWEPAGADEWSPLRARFTEPDAPLMYVQPGRTFGEPGFWPQLREALAGEAVQVVATIGRMDEEVGPLPPNFVAGPHVSHAAVLPHARVAVTAPTTSVTLAALAHGVPGVAIPTGAETPDNAEKLAALGCALRLPAPGLTADALRAAVAEVLYDDELRAGCERARRALGDPHDFGAAAALAEELAERRHGARPAAPLCVTA